MLYRLGLGMLVLVASGLYLATTAADRDGTAAPTLLSHDVYFTLKDNSPAARDKLVAACKKYLSGHPGEVFFAVGTRATDLKREVNDQEFDVALHIVFRTKADHDRYQQAERHQQFIAENRDNWRRVRVFDSLVQR